MHSDNTQLTGKKLLVKHACGAKTRSSHACKSPGMQNGRCRMHGGNSPRVPCGSDHGRYKHGKYTKKAKQQKQEWYQLARELKELFPAPSTRICLEDIDFEIGEIETTTDIKAGFDNFLEKVDQQVLSLEEMKVISAYLTKKQHSLLKLQIDQLVKKVKRREFNL